MPGVANLSVDELVKEAREAHGLGIPAVILFGLPEKKDEAATGAWEENGIVQQAARALKRELPELMIIGDVCLCEYMSHGHCRVVLSRTTQRPPGPRRNSGTGALIRWMLPIGARRCARSRLTWKKVRT